MSIIKLTYVKDIDIEISLEIETERGEIDLKNVKEFYDDNDIQIILIELLHTLNCTREYSSGRPMMTTYPRYQHILNDYYYYLTKIQDQIVYNIYYSKLFERHIENITFENNNLYIAPEEKKRQSNPNLKDRWYRHQSKDLFTGEDNYVYTNNKTGETRISSDPNLLKILNVKEKKERKRKEKSDEIPVSSMTFNFNKKL